MSIVRVRQHVNPLSQKYQTPIQPPNWSQIYASPQQPLLLDIGCARGSFLLEMAAQQPDWNFLGLEIREPLVIRANDACQEAGLKNLHYLFCNANNALHPLLSSLPVGVFQKVAVQFPDPWFKKRHQKRRVIQPEVVGAIAQFLIPSGEVFLQSDVEEVLLEMGDRFHEHPIFQRETGIPEQTPNPFPVMTEREIFTLEQDKPVYRMRFRKKAEG
ncbi:MULTISPECIES: tRNA (guanosine(46)-N7)-methyltransferase TrmB [unclassified Leptolyngbya]|uniref:tRNA (guanosine(46)-N7)-methyltransferase TrmB n=1 Tax=unclassified Leptolyngbya TaxID=2650499 RepID=UPI001688DC68|nr:MULTISPECIES: tRNA (guanosine(46)-N7)-methyltransferase TrmB [unclassified Leptolyngbya]MBD1909306.1 tRNA (guanosine(46)-N7)-methyltransferase TrmB [Leptolyngbya sp. FACHB-8]MBD2153536.1 tRNA (guanosine(46)-N7)-methyltransferase TrmB [Leptolyngbya sp. FACHB-16]